MNLDSSSLVSSAVPSTSKKRTYTYKCKSCDGCFAGPREFLYHRRDVHLEQLVIQECQLCPFATDNTYKLRRHYEHAHDDKSKSPKFKKKSHHSDESLMDSSFDELESSYLEGVEYNAKAFKQGDKFKCPKCPFETSFSQGFTNHIRQRHQLPKKCPYCPFSTIKMVNLEKHIQTHLEEQREPMACYACPFKTISGKLLESHIKTHHSRNSPHPSFVSPVKFPPFPPFIPSSTPPRVHSTLASSSRSSSSSPQNGLSRKQQQHTPTKEKKIHTCKICGYKAKWHSYIQRHMHVHGIDEPFKCNHCPFTARLRGNLYKHLVNAHNDHSFKKKVYTDEDPISTMNFPPPNHTDEETNFYPNITNSKNGPIYPFNQHFPTETHNGQSFYEELNPILQENHFKCSVCSLASVNHSDIEVHIASMKLRSYDHGDARALFVAKEDMTDSGPPEEGQVINLNDANQLPYICYHCGFSNAQKKSVISHLGVHAKVVPYFCGLCNLSSNWQFHISKHIKTEHQADVDTYLRTRLSYEQKNNQIILTGIHPNGVIPTTPTKEVVIQTYQCKVCPFATDKIIGLKRHEKLHQPKKEAAFKCPVCPYYVNLAKTLRAHMRWHGVKLDHRGGGHTPLPLPCPIVPPQPPQAPPPPPPAAPAPPKKYTCEKCPFWANKLAKILFHKQFHRPTRKALFTCNKCTFWANSEDSMLFHYSFHQEAEEKADEKSLDDIEEAKRKLFEEEESNDPPAVYNEEDSQPYLTLESFKNNSATARLFGENVDATSVDNNTEPGIMHSLLFREKQETKAFLTQKASVIAKHTFDCPHCPGYFTSEEMVQFHINMHGSSATYRCHCCDYASSSKANIKFHRHLHKTEKLIECPKCPSRFAKTKNLMSHLQFHGAKNKYTCSHCDYSVANYINVYNHSVVHTTTAASGKSKSETPVVKSTLKDKKCFTCYLCPYLCESKEDLEKHVSDHLVEDGVESCPYCSYSGDIASSHVALHFSWPPSHLKPCAYMRNDNYEIWSTLLLEDSKEPPSLIFKTNKDPSLAFPPLPATKQPADS